MIQLNVSTRSCGALQVTALSSVAGDFVIHETRQEVKLLFLRNQEIRIAQSRHGVLSYITFLTLGC